MVQTFPLLACCAAMLGLWGLIGLSVASRLFDKPLAWFWAPALGWALYSAIALPVFSLVGMSHWVMWTTTALCAFCAVAALWRGPELGFAVGWPSMLTWAGCAVLALAPLAGVLPKETSNGVVLAGPIFDHSKIALIDEIIRSGVPAVNPFFSEVGSPDRVSYYYLWHFSAAALGVIAGASGWEADAALTWFTAFASLMMAAGVAVWISGRSWAGFVAIAIAATTSARPITTWLFGWEPFEYWIWGPSGFGAWLFQVSWAPQHVASAMTVLLAIYLLAVIGSTRGLLAPIVLGLIAAAAFQSSVWVGGITFGLAAAVAGLWLLCTIERPARLPFMLRTTAAAAVALLLSAPFLRDQLVMAASRGGDGFIEISPVEIWGDAVPDWLGRILDLPAYWLIYLPLELPASFAAGMNMLVVIWRRHSISESPYTKPLAILLIASLLVAWLLVSTVGENNDLGWRSVLPAVLLLIGFAAAGIARWVSTRAVVPLAVAGCGLALGLPGGVSQISGNMAASSNPSAIAFAVAPALWDAVRRHTSIQERVANNPLFLSKVTPWPVNISWALLSNRRSCYAGNELALPFAPISAERRAEIEALFVRVFAGEAMAGDIERMADVGGCDVAVVTIQDGAWSRDPFADSSRFRLVENRADAWRIYRKVPKT